MGYFLPFYPLTWPKNENFKNVKETPGDVIILQKCTKNLDQMLYCSWDMLSDGCNCYFSFCAVFCSFTPATAQKMNISKKWKKRLEISSFYTCAPKIMIIITLYCSWDMAHDRGNCYFSFWATFYPFTRYLAPKKRKLKKKKKKTLRISFCTSVTKIMIIC